MTSDAACHSDRGAQLHRTHMHLIPIGRVLWHLILCFFSSFFSQLTILCLYEKEMVLFQFNLLHLVDSFDMMWFFSWSFVPNNNIVFLSFLSRACGC